MRFEKTDVLVAGGGLGGIAAALAVLRLGYRVALTEESGWIGGQLTAQAVPPDEHPWIETTGCTRSYRQLREGIRRYYRAWYPLTDLARQDPRLNPGQGSVSALTHEPRVALAVLEAMLAPYRASGQLQVYLHHLPTTSHIQGDRVEAVRFLDQVNGDDCEIQAALILDATELGDLLELTAVEHVIGAENQAQTGELHALVGAADPLDQQAITWCFAMDYCPGEDHTIEKPEQYQFWLNHRSDFWPGSQLAFTEFNPETLERRTRRLFQAEQEAVDSPDIAWWIYRRIFYAGHYPAQAYPSDITLVNWPMNDYWLGPLVAVTEAERRQHLRNAEQLSRSLLYWLQTEAPRLDGGQGYPGLRLRGDVTGSPAGLALRPYIRESRRILAEFTVTEQHVGVAARQGLTGAADFSDSVGIGSYRIDLHPSTGGRNYVDIPSWPFQIPLGALIPVRCENLLPACKNLGVTHITNGCYRLHPVEWTVGEAAGALAAFCTQRQLTPWQVYHSPARRSDFQALLTGQLGFVLEWPEYARRTAR